MDHGQAPGWAPPSPVFYALGHRFRVVADDAALIALVSDAYSACRDPSGGPADTIYHVTTRGDRSPRSYRVEVDGEVVLSSARASDVPRYLHWHVNQQVIARSDEVVLVHAAVVATGGVGILLAAPMDAGKSTLTAGLVRRGMAYLTDEAAAIEPVSLAVLAYPKPLALDRSSLLALPGLEPLETGETACYVEDQWLVSPDRLRSNAVLHRVPIRHVIFPRYVAGASIQAEPVSRGHALVRLLEQTFRFHEDGRRALDVLSRVVAQSSVHELTSGDLVTACEAVERIATERSTPQEVIAT